MAIGTNITLINTLNDGIDNISDLYINCTEDPDLETAVLISNDYYHFEGDSSGTVVSNDLSSFMVDGEGLGYNIILKTPSGNIVLSNTFFDSRNPNNNSTADWQGLLNAIDSCSETDTITIDCSNITWTINGESGGGGGSNPDDPVIDPNNRIVTGRIINNMPVIPQKWFKSNLDKCLCRSDVKSTHDSNLDVDYYRSGQGNDNQGIPTLATLVPKSCVTIYYKEFSVGYNNSTFCIELSNDNSNSISISRLVVDIVLCEWSIDDNQFLVTNTLDTLSYSSINIKSGTTKTLYPNNSNNHPISFNPSWTFRHLDQRLTFSISATLNGSIDTMKLYTTNSSGLMSEKSSFIDVQWTKSIDNKTFGLDIYGSGNTQSDRNLLIGNSIDSNPGATKIYFDLGWY